MAKKLLMAEPDKCTGCKACQIVCSIKHSGVSSPRKSRIRIIPLGSDIFLPVGCQHCEEAPCMNVCPKDAIYLDQKLERVMVDYDRCVSCRTCAAACPYGAILFEYEHGKIYKCDLCDGAPECVRFCEPRCLKFVDRSMLPYSKMRGAALRMTVGTRKTMPE